MSEVILSFYEQEKEEAVNVIINYLKTLPCITNIELIGDSFSFKHKWTKFRFYCETIKALIFRKSLPPCFDIETAILNLITEEGFNVRIEWN